MGLVDDAALDGFQAIPEWPRTRIVVGPARRDLLHPFPGRRARTDHPKEGARGEIREIQVREEPVLVEIARTDPLLPRSPVQEGLPGVHLDAGTRRQRPSIRPRRPLHDPAGQHLQFPCRKRCRRIGHPAHWMLARVVGELPRQGTRQFPVYVEFERCRQRLARGKGSRASEGQHLHQEGALSA